MQGSRAKYGAEPTVVQLSLCRLLKGCSCVLRTKGDVMLAIGMLAAAAGLVLGLRFSLITLLLLTLAIVITFATSVLGGSNSLAVGTQMLATLASIQISYLFGCLLAAHLPVRSSSERSEARLWCVAGRELGGTTSDKELVRAPALPPGKRQGHIPSVFRRGSEVAAYTSPNLPLGSAS